MSFSTPTKLVQIGPHHVILRGDMRACICYSEISDGYGIENAYMDLVDQLQAVEDGAPLPAYDARPWANLLYAFSATWRAADGWDDERSGDLNKPPLLRRSYTDLISLLSVDQYRNLRTMIHGLLLDSLSPPPPPEPPKPVPAEGAHPVTDES